MAEKLTRVVELGTKGRGSLQMGESNGAVETFSRLPEPAPVEPLGAGTTQIGYFYKIGLYYSQREFLQKYGEEGALGRNPTLADTLSVELPRSLLPGRVQRLL